MKYSRTIQCKKVLFELKLNLKSRNELICYKCGSDDLSSYKKNYIFRCKKCKSKISVTYDTIFHDVRFGLLKAFRIVLEYHEFNYSLSSIKIAKKYNITQKTAWKFLDKIKKNKTEVNKFISRKNELENNPKVNKILKSKEEKLQDYFNF